MTDRELLEKAAKSAGIDLTDAEWHTDGFYWMPLGTRFWNPLTDDGDALRLAVMMRMDVWIGYDGATANGRGRSPGECDITECDGNFFVATRMAIVRAAAEIGRNP